MLEMRFNNSMAMTGKAEPWRCGKIDMPAASVEVAMAVVVMEEGLVVCAGATVVEVAASHVEGSAVATVEATGVDEEAMVAVAVAVASLREEGVVAVTTLVLRSHSHLTPSLTMRRPAESEVPSSTCAM